MCTYILRCFYNERVITFARGQGTRIYVVYVCTRLVVGSGIYLVIHLCCSKGWGYYISSSWLSTVELLNDLNVFLFASVVIIIVVVVAVWVEKKNGSARWTLNSAVIVKAANINLHKNHHIIRTTHHLASNATVFPVCFSKGWRTHCHRLKHQGERK